MKEHTLWTNLGALGRSGTHTIIKPCALGRSQLCKAGDSPLSPSPAEGLREACTSLTPTQTSCTFLLWKDGLRKQKEINPQTPLTGILSVLLSFQTSKSATTMSLSSVRDKTPSRSTSNTLKQTEGKGNDSAVRTTPQGLSLFLAAP